MTNLDWLPERLLVGLSGGADSVALLLLLRETGRQLTAVHVHHGLRGDDADADEAFVKALCLRLGVPLRCYHAVPPAHPSEAWAREARYGFFRQAWQEIDAEAVALAHHLDDQAETLLLHLLRGAGLQGLTGMRQDSMIDGMRIVRPLLSVRRKALQDYLTRRQQPWREDGSNADRTYLRNALRWDILPALEQTAHGAAEHMAHTARLLQADMDALECLTEQFLKQHGGSQPFLPLKPLLQQPEGLQRRILRRWWMLIHSESSILTLLQTETLASLLTGAPGSRCNLPGGWHGYRGWTHVHLLSPQSERSMEDVPVHPSQGAALDHIRLTVTAFDGWHGNGIRTQAVPRSMLEMGLTLRCRRPGDWMRPFGSNGRKSLQDVLVDRHIDQPFRDHIPLLCRGDEVLLAAGIGAGAVPACTKDQAFVLLRWEGDMPWERLTLI